MSVHDYDHVSMSHDMLAITLNYHMFVGPNVLPCALACASVHERLSPGGDMDVLQEAAEAVGEGDAQGAQQVVPAGLHVLAGPALGVALTAHVLMVGGQHIGDEVVVPTGGLEGGGRHQGWD